MDRVIGNDDEANASFLPAQHATVKISQDFHPYQLIFIISKECDRFRGPAPDDILAQIIIRRSVTSVSG